jgi:hypothetical protein
MALEQVKMRTADGQEYGPVSLAELQQWRAQGRVPHDATIIDAMTGEAVPIAGVPGMNTPMPPPPMPMAGYGAPQQPSGMDHLIPAKNGPALASYYVGVLGLAACLLGPLAMVSGIIGIVLGSKGLKKVPEVSVGKTHAIVGIVLGSLQTLFGLAVLVIIIVAIAAGGIPNQN